MHGGIYRCTGIYFFKSALSLAVYSCGSRFCRFGMRSIGKILLQCAGME